MKDTQEAFGIVFAGGKRDDGVSVSYCIHLGDVFELFDISFV